MKPNRALTLSESLCKSHEMVYVQSIDFLNYEILFSIYMSNLGEVYFTKFKVHLRRNRAALESWPSKGFSKKGILFRSAVSLCNLSM